MRRSSSGSGAAARGRPPRRGRTRARRTCGRPAALRPLPRAPGAEERAEPLELRRERRPRELELRLVRDFARTSAARPSARRTAASSGSSPAGSTKSAVDVVRELVAGRALDGPVAQATRPARGSSRPRRAGRLRRAAARGSRAGRRARRDGRRAGRRRAPPARGRAPSLRRLEDLGILDRARRASSSMSKKRRYQPLAGSKSKKLRAQLLVGPETVLRLGRHVVRDDVEDHAEPGVARGSRSSRNASSPPSCSETRVGSTTS